MAAPALPAVLLPTLPLTGDEIVRVRQGTAWVYATVAQIAALVPDPSAALGALMARVSTLETASVSAAQLAAANASIVALAQRVAILEGKPDPCVALSGSLPLATLQIGTATIAVPVPGLLSTDRVAVQPVADLPAGLVLAWAHPKADGMLTVAVDALAVLAIKTPIPLLVTALR